MAADPEIGTSPSSDDANREDLAQEAVSVEMAGNAEVNAEVHTFLDRETGAFGSQIFDASTTVRSRSSGDTRTYILEY